MCPCPSSKCWGTGVFSVMGILLTGAPFRSTDGTKEDGIGGFCCVQSLVGQGLAMGVDGALSDCQYTSLEVKLVEVRTPPRRWSWKLNLRSVCSWMVRRTCRGKIQQL